MCCSNNYYSLNPMSYYGGCPVSYTCYPTSTYGNGGGCCCNGGNGISCNSLTLIALYSLLCR